jgi:SAM-dependent methyltransferase
MKSQHLQEAEIALRAEYCQQAAQYRRDDEIEVASPHHRRLATRLAAISASFGRPISVLDVGCGTGRFFYALQNVERLVGMDICSEMLLAAEQPVHADKITAHNIHLVQANIFFASFARQSFDFIYSFGMFGHGCPVTLEVCNKLHSWLAPGGQLYFDVVDLAGLPWWPQLKKRTRRFLHPILPARVKAALQRRESATPFFGLTKRELAKILRASHFPYFAVVSQICDSPLWRGRHLECRAGVSALNPIAEPVLARPPIAPAIPNMPPALVNS